ncbi:hypothetical protein HELRODRAFT_184158 [Helobdella robusta]|uniref:C-type lectin domain-containing protein n=1 Tax=Helobdella robusta TaxID=6412 RepID=T1FKP4_HELRO|nr:hypothetical protein HELRODRAFT_184158 [Helobdella robusta]ESO07056.1 hypothetical protein HELRODRAFT_184158 [Helobdella robusta]
MMMNSLLFIVILSARLTSSSHHLVFYRSFNTSLYINTEFFARSYKGAEKFCADNNSTILRILNPKQNDHAREFIDIFRRRNQYSVRFLTRLKKVDYEYGHLKAIHPKKDVKNFYLPEEKTPSKRYSRFLSMRHDGTLRTLSNREKIFFICSKPGKCNKSSYKSGDACFQKVKLKKTWYEARAYCILNGGDLFVFDENFKVSMLIEGSLPGEHYWLGYSKFRWYYDEEPELFARYTPWDMEDISSYGSGFTCSNIGIEGGFHWSPTLCNSLISVICMEIIANIILE